MQNADYSLKLRWVAGDSRSKGKELVDAKAKKAAKGTQAMKRTSLLPYTQTPARQCLGNHAIISG
jgi:hypothetical protein